MWDITFQSTLAKSYAYDIIINSNEQNRALREEFTVQDLSCPSLLVIDPAELDPPRTQFSAEQYEVTAGVMAQFSVSWVDRFDNEVNTDPETVQVCIEIPR